MNIRGYLPTSLIEWPGKISAVVFVGGCNFRCPFCHNQDLVLFPEKLPSIPEEEVFEDLKRRKKWIDGVVVTGGEPLLSPDLPEFLKKTKKLGFLTMIETNGIRPKIIAQLLDGSIVDRITLDIKGPLDKEYAKIVGKEKVNIALIRRSIKTIVRSGVDFEFRTTVVPTLHTKENLVKLAKQLRSLNPINWFLQQFVPQNCLNPRFEKIKPYSKKEMEEILKAVKKYFPSVKLRGG